MAKSESLAKVFTDEQRVHLALSLAISTEEKRISPRLADAAQDLGISTGDLAILLNDSSFLHLVRNLSKAQAILTLHSEGIPKLCEIVHKGSTRDSLTAIQTLGILTGDLRSQQQIDVRVTFDDLRKGLAKSGNDPLGSLFEIKSPVIDAEVEVED